MRIKITLDTKNMTLTKYYNHIMQSIIYDNLESDLAERLHSSNSIKNFNFTLLNGPNYTFTTPRGKKLITYLDNSYFYLSSPNEEFVMGFIENLKENRYVRFDNYVAEVLKIEEIKYNISSNKILVRTLSPVTVHRTKDKKTIYFNPFDKEFSKLLNVNFSSKIKNNNELEFSNFTNVNKKIIRYKNFIIEGYTFECYITGTIENLTNALDYGLGDKSSIGFGMVEIVE